MKRRFMIGALIVICLFCFTGQVYPKIFSRGFSVKVSGGTGTMAVGDLNTFSDSRLELFDAYAVFLQAFGYTATLTGGVPHLDRGLDMFAEFMVHMTRRFSIGLGAGYMQRTAEAQLDLFYQDPAEPADSEGVIWQPRPRVTVFPVLLSGYYFLPVMEKLNIFISAGAGLYFGRQSWNTVQRYIWRNDEDLDQLIGRFTGSGFGIHGGIGAEFKITPLLALFIEGRARSAVIKSLKGSEDLLYFGGIVSREGTLWYVEIDDDYLGAIEKSYRADEEKPNRSYMQNVRKWEVDLSGISALIGIRISFGGQRHER